MADQFFYVRFIFTPKVRDASLTLKAVSKEPCRMDAIDPKRSRGTCDKGRPQILTVLVTIVFTLNMGATAMSVELFRYRGAAPGRRHS